MKIPHLILVSFVVLFWGLNFVAIKIGLKTIPPIFLAFLRFFLVAFPAIFFIRRPSVPFTKVIIYGLVMFALQFSLFFAGMYDGVPPGLASILMQMHIFFSILFAAAFFREVPHVWQFVGGILAFSGIYVIASHIGGEMTLKGILLIISATMCWGLGNNISKTLGKVDMVSLVVWGSFFAWPPVLALSFYLEGVDTIVSAIKNLKPLAISCVLYISYMSTLFCFASWSYLLSQYKVAYIAPFSLFAPIVGMVSSCLVLGEKFYPWKLLAGCLVLSGLFVNFLGPKFTYLLQQRRLSE